MRVFNRYLSDNSGQFAIMTAIMAVPLIICVGVAIDTTIMHKKSQGLQNALDTAALAAVIPASLDKNALFKNL